jgi:hypothetical protein
MTLAPDHHTHQDQGSKLQRGDDRKLGHVISFSNPAPVLPCRQGPAMPNLAAGAANGPAAFLSVPLSAFLDAGPCFGPFIDFDDEREFDFSLIPARPRLRLVISNSSSVSRA